MYSGRYVGRFVALLALLAVGATAALILPAPSGSQGSPYNLTAFCGDMVPSPSIYVMRLRNQSSTAQAYTWRDQNSGQAGSGTAPANSDTFFHVLNAQASHTIIVTIGGTQLTKATNTAICQGEIRVRKVVEGPGSEPPGATYAIRVSGSSGFAETATLTAGGSQTYTVPGTYAAESVPVGTSPRGYDYTISELDGLGANVTVSPQIITVNRGDPGNPVVSTVANQFPAGPVPPDPPGPDPEPVPRPGTADLVLQKDVAPTRARVGQVVTYTVRVRNDGPETAVGVTGRDIPQRSRPNLVARVLSITASQGTCTALRPVTCSFGDIPPGGEVTLTARVRPRISGVLENLADVVSQTPDPNPSNNQETAGLTVRPGRAAVTITKSAARSRVVPGDTLRFRLGIRSRGPNEAFGVRVCDLLPRGLRVLDAGTAAVRGRLACWVIRALPVGREASLSLLTRAVAISTASTRITNTATVNSVRGRRRQARASVTLAGAGVGACPAARAGAAC